MTARLAPAAQQLVDQVQASRKCKVTYGDPDGLGRIREVTFDAATSRWLSPILCAIGDQRIKSIVTTGKGRTSVVFVPDYRADFKNEFPIAEVDEILND